MSVYWLIVIAVIGLGMILPQQGYYKKWYVGIMAVLHTFVCGFRYMYLTGDLRNYAATYYDIVNYSWASNEVIQEGRNTGFHLFMKLVSGITNGDFQVFLFLIAIIIEVVIAIMIFQYSPKPWLSYLVWNCFGFYVFGFSAIKQALAMAFIMCSMKAILEDNLKKFLIFVFIATTIHMPAFAFLPAYWIAKSRINGKTILGYIVAYIVIYIFRNPLVDFFGKFYYEEEQLEMFQDAQGLGGRFYLIILILLCGIILKGFKERNFEKLFNMIIVAAIFQMFSSVDNIFTRFADYYFQMVVLYIPMIFSEMKGKVKYNQNYMPAFLLFNKRSLNIFVAVLAVILIWYYNYSCLGTTIEYAVDDYLNFRFMWDVLN